MKWLVLATLMLTSFSCRASGVCDDDADCFENESCERQACVVVSEMDAGPTCDPADCMGPQVAETICSLDVCEIVACDEQAVLCETGCCKVGPVENHEIASTPDQIFVTPHVEVGPNGFPHVVYGELESSEIFHVFWDGAAWRHEQLALFPTALLAFDIAIDESNRLWVVYTGTDENAYVAEPDEFGGHVSHVIFEAPTRDPAEMVAFLRYSLEVHDGVAAVCSLYGTEVLARGEATHPSLPHVWEGRKMFNTGEYRGARIEGFERVPLNCSTAFSQSGRRHTAFSALIEDSYVVQWAEEAMDGSGFDFDADPPLFFGALSHRDALEIDGDGLPHIVFGQRYTAMDGTTDTAEVVHLWRDSTGWTGESARVEDDPTDDLGFARAALQWVAPDLHITFLRANLRAFEATPWTGVWSNGTWDTADLGLGSTTVFDQRVGEDGRAHRIWIAGPTGRTLNYAVE